MNLSIEQFLKESIKHMVSHMEHGTMHSIPQPAALTFADDAGPKDLTMILLHD